MTQISKIMPALPDRDRRRVVASAALMASDKDGEVLAAVRAICRMLIPHGIGPADLIAAALTAGHLDTSRRQRAPHPFGAPRSRTEPPRAMYPSTRYQRLARLCLFQGGDINDWEREFLTSILRERSLTARQQQKLHDIAARIDAKMKERRHDSNF